MIKFSKDKSEWFTVWDGNVIKKFKGEKKRVVAMRPYLDEIYNIDDVKNTIKRFDDRSFYYANLITFKEFQKNIELLKPRQ